MGAPEGNPGIEAELKVCDNTMPDLGPSERTPHSQGSSGIEAGPGGVQHKIKKGGVLKREGEGRTSKKEKRMWAQSKAQPHRQYLERPEV